MSFIFLIIELIAGREVIWLGFIWMITFFINLFVIAFDVSSTKFFIILLAILIAVLIIVFLVLPYFTLPNLSGEEMNIGMTYQFYIGVTLILGFILLIAFLGSRFDYWKIERNEVLHKKGLTFAENRFPTRSLRFNKKIQDVFEFFLLGAGSITLNFGQPNIFHLNTVPGIEKKSRQLDFLLSDLEVKVDNLDGK